MHIKPKDKILVRDPHTMRIVPPEGLDVPDADLFWHRLLMDGDFDVVESDKTEDAHHG